MITWMWLRTSYSYLREILYRSVTWPRAQPTCSGCRLSAVMAGLEAPAWRNSSRPQLKVQRRNSRENVAHALFKNGISLKRLVFSLLSRAPFSKQHSSHLQRSIWRSGNVVHSDRGPVPTQTVSNCPPPISALPICLSVLLINQTAPSFTGFLSHSFAFPLWGLQMAFAFTLSSPLSFSLPLAKFLFLWICVPALTREEFALNVRCQCSMVIFQWVLGPLKANWSMVVHCWR